MGPGLTRRKNDLGNCPRIVLPVLMFWVPCIVCVYTLLQVVSHYDLTVLSMSVMGFQKKFGWCVG